MTTAQYVPLRYKDMSESDKRMIAMCGATAAQMRYCVEQKWAKESKFGDCDKRTVASRMAMSILSDAQELLENGENYDVEQAINRAKWILAEFVNIDLREAN